MILNKIVILLTLNESKYITIVCFLTVKNSLWEKLHDLRTPCHARGHFVFLLSPLPCYLGDAMPCQWSSSSFGDPANQPASQPDCQYQSFPGSRQFNVNVSRASCCSSKYSSGPTICLNHSNPQTLYSERFIFKAYHIIKTLLVVRHARTCQQLMIYIKNINT